MTHKIGVVEHAGASFQGKWSGDEIPDVGTELSGLFGDQWVPVKVTGYFREHGFLGCLAQTLRLPENLHEFSSFLPYGEGIGSVLTFQEYVVKPDAFTAHFFGLELSAPTPYKFPQHDALEEFAVLVAAASYGRNTWRHNLQDCWMNGTYNRYSYGFFSGELQRVRNNEGRAFVDYVVGRHQQWIDRARRALT
jgi:hypothetical protein